MSIEQPADKAPIEPAATNPPVTSASLAADQEQAGRKATPFGKDDTSAPASESDFGPDQDARGDQEEAVTGNLVNLPPG